MSKGCAYKEKIERTSPLPAINESAGLTTAAKQMPEYVNVSIISSTNLSTDATLSHGKVTASSPAAEKAESTSAACAEIKEDNESTTQTLASAAHASVAVKDDSPDSSQPSDLWKEAPLSILSAVKDIKLWKMTAENRDQCFKEIQASAELLQNAPLQDFVQSPEIYTSACMYRHSTQSNNLHRILQFSVWRSRSPVHKNRYDSVGIVLEKDGISFLKRMWGSIINELDKLDTYESLAQSQPKIITAISNYYRALNVIWNGTDHPFPERRLRVLKEFLPFIMEGFGTRFLSKPMSDVKGQVDVLRSYLGIMHNLVQYTDDGLTEMRALDAFQHVNKLSQTKLVSLKTKVVLMLAWLITEKDSKDSLATSTANMQHLVNILKSAMSGKDRYSSKFGYHATEMFNGLNRMAALDQNKRLLVQCGALPLYVEAMQEDTQISPEKLIELNLCGVEGIWTLSFDKKNQEDMLKEESGCIDALKRLVKSENKDIKKAAAGALWNLGGEEEHLKDKIDTPQKLDHIMISYNWGVKEHVYQLHKKLKAAGYRIWIDIERMNTGGGSTLEAMSSAVENASVVLVCYTEKYKLSSACRSEAEYAFKLRKNIIPVRMQHLYDADGWLGILLGTKLYYDLTREHKVDKTITDLIAAIGKVAKHGAHNDTWNDAVGAVDVKLEEAKFVSPSGAEPTSYAIEKSTNPVFSYSQLQCLNWSESNVMKWLSDNKLEQCCKSLGGMTGEYLAELCSLQVLHPDTYYSLLREELKLGLMDILRLNTAIKKLSCYT